MISTKKTRNFTEGPLFFKILLFALPIMLTGILQIMYNMADNIVVGQWSGDENALGAVGSTSSLNNLVITMITGTAAGTGVVVAQCIGARRDRDVSRAVHTAISFSLFLGIGFSALGLLISRPVLAMIGTQDILLDQAVLYMRIICLGIPATSVYNFGSSILRSAGDSRTPLIILTSTGIINVLLNLFFVIACGMSVEGVALATIIAQYVSAAAVIIVLMKKHGESYQFSFKKLCFDMVLFKRILRIGIPSGIQSSFFSLANIVLTNGINSFGDPNVITAYTITNNIDSITYIACNSFYQAAMTFTGQNYGAMKHERVKKTLVFSLIQVTVVGIAISQLIMLFREQIISLYIASDAQNKSELIALCHDMMQILLNTYFLCGVMEVVMGVMRGLGYSISPMLISLTGACAFRIFWRYVFFPLEPLNTPQGLLLCFPLSWIITILMLIVLFLVAWKKLKIMFAVTKENANRDSKA
ncbi:MAG: MATE family efflux transporter [Ruminococcaceae bacterium]|nr:MATE family efflux transporter [Oscillospiraceae bacterium]